MKITINGRYALRQNPKEEVTIYAVLDEPDCRGRLIHGYSPSVGAMTWITAMGRSSDVVEYHLDLVPLQEKIECWILVNSEGKPNTWFTCEETAKNAAGPHCRVARMVEADD